jgi:hypothetical protein
MKRSMLTLIALAAIILFSALWYGFTPAKAPQSTGQVTSVAFTELAKGEQSSVSTRENYLITTPEQLKALWDLLNTSTPLPSVDFDTSQVIAVFAGKEPSAGYTITVTKVADASLRMVTIQTATPGPSCTAAQVVTTPYQVLLLPKTPLTLTHEDTATTTSCWQ